MTRRFLLTCIFNLFVCFCFATNYYLSNSGNDGSSGTSPFEAWQTIDHLNAITLQSGDSILFESGGVFRGEIELKNSGTSDSIIYFGKYGTGALPIISGALEVTGWSYYQNNIYYASFSSVASQLFADDELMTIARYPNHGYLFHQGPIGNNGFIDSSLNQEINYWKGATVRMRMNDRAWESGSVDSSNASEIILESPFVFPIQGGYGYYFDNLLTLLDTAGEWYYSPSGEVYFYSPSGDDPSLLQVEVSVFNYGLKILNAARFITVENLQFEKQALSGVSSDSSINNILVHQCIFREQAQIGIDIYSGGSQIDISDNSFYECQSMAIRVRQVDSTSINQNSMRKIGITPGVGDAVQLNGVAIVAEQSGHVTISLNSIDSCGSSGISIAANNCLVDKNLITNSFLVSNNWGVITNADPLNEKNILSDNFILSAEGNNEATPANVIYASGILLSDSCSGCGIFHNTIAETSGSGIQFGDRSNLYSTKSNLIYGCKESQLRFADGAVANSTHGNEAKNNILYSIGEDQDIVQLQSSSLSFLPAVFDSNYYFNPYDYYAYHLILDTMNGEFNFHYTLEQWQYKTTLDLNSKTTFVSWHRFLPVDTLNSELIGNGTFTSNFDGWQNTLPDNLTMLLDNSTPLDGGCLKLVKNGGQYLVGSAYTDGISIDSGLFYLAAVSNYSVKEGNTRIYLSMVDSPFLSLGLNRYFPFTSKADSYWNIFQPPKNCDNSRFDVFISYEDSIAWVDNISLIPVSASYVEPRSKSRLFTNYSPSPVSFDLGDSVFYNMDQQQVQGLLTVNPYSSVVLLFDSSLILGTETPKNENVFSIFPNPVSPGSVIQIRSLDSKAQATDVRICFQDGSLVDEFSLKNQKVFQFKVPDDAASGIYLILITAETTTYVQKLVVVR